MDNLFKLKKDGKTVGYLEFKDGKFIYSNEDSSYVSPYLISIWKGKVFSFSAPAYGSSYYEHDECEYDSIHPYVTDDKNGDKVFAGDRISFLLAFPLSQTHVGDNIPGGSYTEPDDPFFHRITAEVIWDEDRGRWGWSIIGDVPYGFHQMPRWFDWEEVLPILGREPYTIEYIKELCGKCDEEDCSECDFLKEAGVSKFEELENVLNDIELIKEQDNG